MSIGCCSDGCNTAQVVDKRYAKVLWIALVLNFGMFALEVIGGSSALSVALFADSIDFFSDGVNFALSLLALSLALVWRSRLAMVKGAAMVLMGLFVLWRGWQHFSSDSVPEPFTMAWIGLLALLINGLIAYLLYRYRAGDAHMRSVWLCSRNDAIGNVAVILAAAGVFGSSQNWPDLLVALVMATLSIWSGLSIVRLADGEIDGHAGHHH
jgi:Co/Zn/Cd efflux system component